MTLETGTSNLHVVVEGSSLGDPIVLLHGGPGVPDYLQAVASILNGNAQTIRFDQRGVGASTATAGTYDIEGYVNDIDAVVEAVEAKRVHLFGHSWGGLLAQIYAAYRPQNIKSLFLSSPSSGAGETWKLMEREVVAYNKRQATNVEWLEMGINSLLGMIGSDGAYQKVFSYVWRYYFKNPKQAPEADRAWLNGIRARAVNRTRRSILELRDQELWSNLSGLNVPVCLLYGEYDIYGDSRKHSLERWPKAKCITMNGVGHLPWIQGQQEFTHILHSFYGK